MTGQLTRLVLLSFSVSAFGCAADGGSSMIILHNVAPEVMDEGATCTFSATSDEFVSAGMLDLETPQDYTFAPAIRGGLQADPNTPTNRHIVLRGADVILKSAPSARSQMAIDSIGIDNLRRTVITSGTIEPGDDSRVVIFLSLIDADQARLLSNNAFLDEATQIIARVQVFGEVDGNDVESDFFEYPITLCRDCVLDNEDIVYDAEGMPLPDTSTRRRTSGCFGDQYP